MEMRNSKLTVSILILITFLGISARAAEPEALKLVYRDRTGETISQKEFVLQKKQDGYLLRVIHQDNVSEILSDHNFEACEIDQTRSNSPDHYSIKREKNHLAYSGNKSGQNYSKRDWIGREKWVGVPFLLGDFALSGKKKEEFYMASPDHQLSMKFKAVREKTEEIEVLGEKVKAIKVKLCLPDWREPFWASYFWFRASDGIMVRTEETRGFPGTPKTKVELIQETRI